jgi:mRNA deadenylase 3'-5' endonuclease subunit Ccr4
MSWFFNTYSEYALKYTLCLKRYNSMSRKVKTTYNSNFEGSICYLYYMYGQIRVNQSTQSFPAKLYLECLDALANKLSYSLCA